MHFNGIFRKNHPAIGPPISTWPHTRRATCARLSARADRRKGTIHLPPAGRKHRWIPYKTGSSGSRTHMISCVPYFAYMFHIQHITGGFTKKTWNPGNLLGVNFFGSQGFDPYPFREARWPWLSMSSKYDEVNRVTECWFNIPQCACDVTNSKLLVCPLTKVKNNRTSSTRHLCSLVHSQFSDKGQLAPQFVPHLGPWTHCDDRCIAANWPSFPWLVNLDSVSLKIGTWKNYHWIGLRENLQETMVFTIKYIGRSCKFSHHPILWNYEEMVSSPPESWNVMDFKTHWACLFVARSGAVIYHWSTKYPLVNIQKAIENGPVEIVDFPINSMVDLSTANC